MDKVITDIQSLISEQIRPQLKAHGGDLEFLELKDNIVRVQLLGACSSCPSNQQTVSHVIEDTIRQKYSQLSVEVEFGVSNELINEALQMLRKHKN